MKRFKQFILIAFILTFSVQAVAQQLPVSRMQNAISGTIQQKLFGRGLVQFDPRIGITLQGAGASIGGAVGGAAAITAAGVTAPAWVTVGATVALGALFTVGINLAIDGVKWLLNGDGTVTVGTPSSSGGLPVGKSYRVGNALYASISDALMNGSSMSTATDAAANCCGTGFFWKYEFGPVPGYSTMRLQKIYQGNPVDIFVYSNYIESVYDSPPNRALINADPVAGPVPTTPSAAAAAVSDADKAKPLNPAVIAQIADAAFRKAAQELGYAGAPYDVNDPITEADVRQWIAAHPAFAPTVADVLQPQPAPAGGTAVSPFTLPVGAPSATADPAATSPVTNPGTGTQVNIGPDPGIGFPTLETIPTAQAILSPIFNLLPSFRNFVVPSHSSVCPKPSMTIFNKFVVMDAHCSILEDIRPTLYSVMFFVWLMISILIVLAA